eukprot:Skav209558  [mRNA]  locus=scaffold2497:528000:530918:+ [translate_table: standard]
MCVHCVHWLPPSILSGGVATSPLLRTLWMKSQEAEDEVAPQGGSRCADGAAASTNSRSSRTFRRARFGGWGGAKGWP